MREFEQLNRELQNLYAVQTPSEEQNNRISDILARQKAILADDGRNPQFKMEGTELQRQQDVALGKTNIDRNFGKFDQSYYDQYKTDYTNYYQPQLQDQYADARGKLVAALAGRGMLDSTVGAGATAKLAKQNTDTQMQIANQANDAANKLKGTVESSKSNLYGLNQASADPKGINARSIGEATALVAPPQFSPLEQVFSAALAPWMNYASAYGNRAGPAYSSPIRTATGRGSGTVVK